VTIVENVRTCTFCSIFGIQTSPWYPSLQVYVDNILYQNGVSPEPGEIIILHQTGYTPINFVSNIDGNIGEALPLTITKTMRSGHITPFLFTATTWYALS
jgi:hypothetical protein